MKALLRLGMLGWCLCFGLNRGGAATNVYLTEVPDYQWWAGCFGTASGNLMGFWDRHGFPDFYTGPTAGGVAPLNNAGNNAGIISMWASQAGVDGRPQDQFGHYDDYYAKYENTGPDPYVLAGRPEHAPDCIGDFIGLSQLKWTGMAHECDGNIDGFSFVYWDSTGVRRVNYVPGTDAGTPARDIQSGLRAWTQYRGYDAVVFTQLADFNPHTPPGRGFTFNDLKAEIDAGYPVLLFLQSNNEFSRSFPGMPRANPEMHGMLAYGYYLADNGLNYVRYRTSWASGDNNLKSWDGNYWEAGMPVRGLVGFHPLPKITSYNLINGQLTLQWDGPAARLYNASTGITTSPQAYIVERATILAAKDFVEVSPVLTDRFFTITNPIPVTSYYRIKLVQP